MRRERRSGEVRPLPPRRTHTATLFAGIAWIGLTVAACGDPAAAPIEPDIPRPDPMHPGVLTALAWVGAYGGSGSVTEDGTTTAYTDLLMRISFDADSIRGLQCPQCVTISVEPWFSRGNLEITETAETSLAYEADGVSRILTMNRFSGAGGTSNTVLAQLRYERADPAGTVTLLEGIFEFFAR